MACNGVGTPRLLLHSSSNLFEGLANRSGLVGKMMFHINRRTGYLRRNERSRRAYGLFDTFAEFYESDPSRVFKGLWFALWTLHNTNDLSLGGYGVDNPFLGNEHLEIMDNISYLAGLTIVAEDLPEEHNCANSWSRFKRHDGIPAPKLTPYWAKILKQ